MSLVWILWCWTSVSGLGPLVWVQNLWSGYSDLGPVSLVWVLRSEASASGLGTVSLVWVLWSEASFSDLGLLVWDQCLWSGVPVTVVGQTNRKTMAGQRSRLLTSDQFTQNYRFMTSSSVQQEHDSPNRKFNQNKEK